jgi:tripartite ATP-independent transporter DctM subunit
MNKNTLGEIKSPDRIADGDEHTSDEQKTFALPLFSIMGKAIDRILEAIGIVALVMSIGATLLQVFLRYVLNSPVSWSEELSRFTFIWLTFIAAAIAIRSGEMLVRVDTLILKFPLWAQRQAKNLSTLVVAGIGITLVVFGGEVVTDMMGQVSIAMEWPVSLFYAAAPIGGVFILLNLIRFETRKEDKLRVFIIVVVTAILFWFFFKSDFLTPPELNIGVMVIFGVVALILLGIPIAYAIAGGALLGFWLIDVPMTAHPHQWVNGVDSFLLLAIPFFLLAGQLMNEGGITNRLFSLASVIVGHFPGGLAHVNCVASFLLGGMSGSSSGDVAATTKTLVPEMVKRGYAKAFSCAITAASAILSNLVPPSIMLMVYASVAEESVGRLFLAGVLPAVVLTISLMACAHSISVKRNYKGVERKANKKEVIHEAKQAMWALPMPVIILVGIRYGITTPTEAAAVAVAYALFVGMFIYREIKPSRLPRLLLKACLETSMIMMILGASRPFSWVLTAEQIPQNAAQLLTSLTSNPTVILIVILLFLLCVGLVLESTPAIIILVPIMLPIVKNIGFDTVQFGVVVVLVTLAGSLTPPVGLLVFISSGIAKIPPMSVFRELLPMLAAIIVVVALIAFIPQLSLWLPNLIMPVASP